MRRNKMRKKVERLERRDREKTKKAEELKFTDGIYSKKYLSNIRELDKEEKQFDEWKAVKKHPVTKIVMVVGIAMGLIYVSSFAFNIATKAAISYKNFRKALKD